MCQHGGESGVDDGGGVADDDGVDGVDGVDDEDCVGNSLFQTWKLRFSHKAKLLFRL